MTSPIEDLLAHLEANPELRNAIITATTLEEATKIAENAGFKIDGKDLCNAHKDELLELSDDELDVIAGGKIGKPGCAQAGSTPVPIIHSAMKQC